MKATVSVKNFGPIEHAAVQLRPLTVFVGPSNTGKTYLATLFYAAHRIFNGFPQLPVMTYLSDGPNFPTFGIFRFANVDISNDDMAFLTELGTEEQEIPYKKLPRCVHEFVTNSISGPLAPTLEFELSRLFDVESMSDLVSAYGEADTATISVAVHRDQEGAATHSPPIPLWMVETNIGGSEPVTHFSPPDGPIFISSTSSNSRFNDFQAGSNWPDSRYKRYLFENLLERLLPKLGRNWATFLPAERSGIMQSHLVISSAIIDMATRGGIQRLPDILTLPGTAADFLSNLLLLNDRKSMGRVRGGRKGDTLGDDIVRHIEQEVLKGDVSIQYGKESPNSRIEYSPHELDLELPLNRSSAMVTELAPLVLYLREMVRPGDLLVIEEPESHLHPAAQTHMASVIARIVRMGVHVVVTTHSDWLIQAFGNLVRRGELAADGVDPFPTESSNDRLLKKEIGVWGFNSNGTRGSIVEEIQFDWDQGIEPPEYQRVMEQLYNDTTMLYNRHVAESDGSVSDVE